MLLFCFLFFFVLLIYVCMCTLCCCSFSIIIYFGLFRLLSFAVAVIVGIRFYFEGNDLLRIALNCSCLLLWVAFVENTIFDKRQYSFDTSYVYLSFKDVPRSVEID